MDQQEQKPIKPIRRSRTPKTLVEESALEKQLTVYEKDGALLVRTSDQFNKAPEVKQNLIVSAVVDILMKTNQSDTLFSVGLSEDSDVSMKVFENFSVLSLASQERILKKLSVMMRKLAEAKCSEKENNSEWIH